MSTPTNYVTTRAGLVRPVCEFCGLVARQGRPPREDGQPSFLRLPLGWAVAPYSASYVHDDGSHGSRFSCPACRARMRSGDLLRSRMEARQ